MATATKFSLGTGGGRRRRHWPCRAAPARGGRKTGGAGCGCLHLHVHFHHSPRQVRALFSPLFSLLPHLFILPVLFLAVLAFLVCVGWFTLVYFVSSLLSRTRDSPDADRPEENCRREDGEERCCRDEEQARNKADTDGDYCVAEEGTDTDSRTTSSCTGGTANNRVNHLHSGYQESVGTPAYVNSVGWIDKRVTRTVVVICSEYSSAAAQSSVKFGEDLLLPDAIAAKKLIPKEFFAQQRDTQTTMCTTDVRATEIREEERFSEEQGKHVSGVSDEINNESEMSGLLLLDSLSESRYDYDTAVDASKASLDDSSSVEEDEHEKQVTEDNNRAGTRPAAACDDFSESNQATTEEVRVPSTENSISQEESSAASGRTEDDDDNCCTSPEGGSRRSPLVRWWNLCGVLEVFAGCND